MGGLPKSLDRGSALSRTFWVAVSTGALAAVWLTGCGSSNQTRSAGPLPPVPVSVAKADTESVPLEVRAVGTVEASAVIQVKSQVAGELVKVAFEEGANVQPGDLLFVIDERPYQEALEQAQTSLAKDNALLRQAQANLARDVAQSKSLEADAARNAQMDKEHIVSQSQSDQSTAAAEAIRATINADEAAIESARASIESDRTAIDTAKLNLSYCEIHAPVNGRVGNLLVHQGNLVAANAATALVTINRLQPIWVSFRNPGIASIRDPAERGTGPERGQAPRHRLAAKRCQTGRPWHPDRDRQHCGCKHRHDQTQSRLRQYQRLAVAGSIRGRFAHLGHASNVVVVPAEAVQPGQRGQVVYVVKEDQSVDLRPVTVGVSRGNRVVIDKGLETGETVVTDGQLRLFPGAKIRAVPPGTCGFAGTVTAMT